MSFSTLGLSDYLVEIVKDMGYSKPTKIQQKALPAILSGKDTLISAETGTGKTAAFILPILQKITGGKSRERVDGKHMDPAHRSPKVLILVPTRELAKQMEGYIGNFGGYLQLKTVALYGGKNLKVQAAHISEGIDILIATPGRLLEHLAKRGLQLHMIDYFVVDEADTLLEMGFLGDVSRIIHSMKSRRQNILLSATLPSSLRAFSRELFRQTPIQIGDANIKEISASIRQVLHPVEKEKKLELLSYLIGSRNYKQVLVFVRKKREADQVAIELERSGLKTAVIHGDRSSGARSRALAGFREKKIRVLVATDIAARGLDIKALDIVINYDIPHVMHDYVHRIGRTGRGGRKGLAITLSTPEETIELKSLERMLGKAIPVEKIPGYFPVMQRKQFGVGKEEKQNVGSKRTAGAFGNRKKRVSSTKKRKTSKRDRFK